MVVRAALVFAWQPYSPGGDGLGPTRRRFVSNVSRIYCAFTIKSAHCNEADEASHSVIIRSGRA